MKKIFTLFAFVLLAFTSFAQSSNSDTYDDLMRQSRKARTTSTIFVIAGPVIAAGGVGTLIYGLLANEIDGGNEVYDNNGNFIGYDNKKHTTEIIVGAAGALAGIALALTSIPFSNKASDLKREARKAKLKTSTDRISIPGLQNGFANNKARQFKVSLVIPLGR